AGGRRTDGRVRARWGRRGQCRLAGPARRAVVLVACGHDAAVDVPDGGGDPAGGRGEQEGDGVGQVAGGADPAQRVEAVEAVQGLVELVLGDEPLVQRGGHDGGGDRVDPDLVRGQLDGQVAGQRVQPGLGHRVRRGRGGGDGL